MAPGINSPDFSSFPFSLSSAITEQVKELFTTPAPNVKSEDKDEGKDKEEKSGKLITGDIKTASAGPIMSEDKDEEKDKEGKLI